MNWYNQENQDNPMYRTIEYKVEQNNFSIPINTNKEKIIGFFCKFVDQDDNPVTLNESESYLSITRVIEGQFLNYQMEEKCMCDMNHFTSHQQFMNNLPSNNFVWTYFFKPVTNHKFNLNFEISYVKKNIKSMYLYINILLLQTNNLSPSEFLFKCAQNDYNKGLDENTKPNILWMHKEMDDDV